MKVLKKTIMYFLFALTMLGVCSISVFASDAGNLDALVDAGVTSGFDQNVHGEIVEEGECGVDAKYKLYSDETLYVYGSGEVYADNKPLFRDKYVLKTYIEDGITSIGRNVFYGCEEMKIMRLPNSVENIGDSAFGDCVSLKEIQIPDGVETIGSYVFLSCRNLNSIHLPNSVKTIGNYAFGSCENLMEIKIPEKVSTIQAQTFEFCKSLTKIILPDGLHTIEASAFGHCESLREINLPDGLEDIADSAFFWCGLEKISIPRNVFSINRRAFSYCRQLEKVLVLGDSTKLRLEAFSNCGKLTIYCNENSEAERYAKENGISYKPISLWNHEHTYESSTTKEPTCTETGIKTFTCGCGDEYTEEIPETGHDIVIDSAVDPTETEPGKTEGSHCRACGEVLKAQEIIPAIGTSTPSPMPEEPNDSEIVIKNTFNGCKGNPLSLNVSCTSVDEFTFECMDDCGMQSRYDGWSLTSVFSKRYELTFPISGEHTITVYKNGVFMENDKVIVAEDHTWDSGIISKAATCTTPGKKTYTCSNCESTREESIPKIGHDYLNVGITQPTCATNGEKVYICLKCAHSYSESIPKTGHVYQPWEVSKKPTIFSKGERRVKCAKCGKILKKEDIKKLSSSVKISKNNLKLRKGKTYKLNVKMKTNGDKISKWTTSNRSIVSVDKKTGKIKALKKGKATITLKMKSGCKAICRVTVI